MVHPAPQGLNNRISLFLSMKKLLALIVISIFLAGCFWAQYPEPGDSNIPDFPDGTTPNPPQPPAGNPPAEPPPAQPEPPADQPSSLQASFSNGTATYKAYKTDEFDQHWTINNIEFDAQSNKEAMLMIPTELLNESGQKVSNVTLSVLLQPGNQRIKFLENDVMIGLLANKRGNYTVSMAFMDVDKKVGELKIPVLVGATGLPVRKSVKLEALNIIASQQSFTHGCTSLIHVEFDQNALNTGNTEVFGKIIADVLLDGKKENTETIDYISLLLVPGKNTFGQKVYATFPSPVSGTCYFGKTVSLEMRFLDDENEIAGEGSSEAEIVREN